MCFNNNSSCTSCFWAQNRSSCCGCRSDFITFPVTLNVGGCCRTVLVVASTQRNGSFSQNSSCCGCNNNSCCGSNTNGCGCSHSGSCGCNRCGCNNNGCCGCNRCGCNNNGRCGCNGCSRWSWGNDGFGDGYYARQYALSGYNCRYVTN